LHVCLQSYPSPDEISEARHLHRHHARVLVDLPTCKHSTSRTLVRSRQARCQAQAPAPHPCLNSWSRAQVAQLLLSTRRSPSTHYLTHARFLFSFLSDRVMNDLAYNTLPTLLVWISMLVCPFCAYYFGGVDLIIYTTNVALHILPIYTNPYITCNTNEMSRLPNPTKIRFSLPKMMR